jgi:rare lipoprotein A
MENRLHKPYYYGFADLDAEREARRWTPKRVPTLVFAVSLIIAILSILIGVWIAYAAEIPPATGTATYYTIASCLKESGQYRMANGSLLDDEKYTAASWFFSFGDKVKVINRSNGKFVIVTITDRGPAKRLVRRGKIIDLSKAAFQALADLRQGVIPVKVEKIKQLARLK